MKKLNKQQFFSTVAPSALLVYLQDSPIFPSVRIAYSYIKSNGILTAWNNLTLIHVEDGQLSSHWRGEYVIEHTGQLKQCSSEIMKESVRAYRTIYHSFVDEDIHYSYKENEQITRAKSPYLQTKALIKWRKEDDTLIEQVNSFIQLYQLEHYDNIDKFYDKPSYVLKEDMIPVIYEDELIAIAFIVDNLIFISLRKIQEYQVINVEERNRIFRVNGHIVKAFTSDNLCYVNLEDLKKILLFQVEWDQHAKVLSLL